MANEWLFLFAGVFALVGLFLYAHVKKVWRQMDCLKADREEFPKACAEARIQAIAEQRAAGSFVETDEVPPKIPLPWQRAARSRHRAF
jgi:hypothetical protein